jgi:ABC-type transporter Mla MlaB component
MTICMTGTEARLEGDWTLTGVARNIDSLALSLQQIKPGSEKSLRVDCGQMKEVDISGMQLLNVWMQCARYRGVEPMLVNVPNNLRHAMKVLVAHFDIDTCTDAVVMAG